MKQQIMLIISSASTYFETALAAHVGSPRNLLGPYSIFSLSADAIPDLAEADLLDVVSLGAIEWTEENPGQAYDPVQVLTEVANAMFAPEDLRAIQLTAAQAKQLEQSPQWIQWAEDHGVSTSNPD